MGRPALPKNVHILKGTGKTHPERMRERADEPENKNPLGNAPKSLNANEKVYWDLIKKESIPGVLGEADRLAVGIASKLLAKAYSEEGAASAELAQLIRLLAQFGMTPADRSKISMPAKKVKNAFDE